MKKKRPRPRLLFVIDPWDTLDHANDTTLRLLEEAKAAGARCTIAENRGIGLADGLPRAEVREITAITAPRTPADIVRGPTRWQALTDFDHIFYRVDPPVDLAYLLPLQILAALKRGRGKNAPRIHSPAEALFSLNEKWVAAELGALFPRSLVSASVDRLIAFAETHGKVVLKPLYLAQSKGIIVLDAAVSTRAALRRSVLRATENGKLPIILQEFLPGIARGETRLWFAAGKLLASAKKIPKTGEAIIDMDHGGRLAQVRLSVKERSAAKRIGVFLRRHGILFAAVDLIDGKITDFNHTSPGLLVAMEKLLGENLARPALRTILTT